MSRTLYLECSSGISGDMTVAALLDLGADEGVLRKALASLPVTGYELHISRVKKAGLDLCDFEVRLDHAHENHDHDMEYLHGTEAHHHARHGSHVPSHHHEMPDKHHAAHHEHRNLAEILQIIHAGDMTDRAKKTAADIFGIIAEAEAKAHGLPVNEVHFHEVGAVDSIVDIVSAAVCLDDLDITEVIVEELYEGRGTIRCQHGVIPVPVPAVVNIAEKHQLKLKITDTQGELVTPTGAAIVAAVRTSEKLPAQFVIEKIGMGAGKRNYDRPGMLRAMLIQAEAPDNGVQKDEIIKLETNIDDSTGEMLGAVMEKLLKAGARDVSYTPVFMKKNRPAYQMTVICKEEDCKKLEKILFEETTTIGIRKMHMERTLLAREQRKISTPLGEVEVKVCRLPSGERIYPEYEEVMKLCRKHQMPYYEVWQMICGSQTASVRPR